MGPALAVLTFYHCCGLYDQNHAFITAFIRYGRGAVCLESMYPKARVNKTDRTPFREQHIHAGENQLVAFNASFNLEFFVFAKAFNAISIR